MQTLEVEMGVKEGIRINKDELMEKFQHLSYDDLMDLIYEVNMNCNTINASEKEAKIWLSKYGLKFYYQHEEMKEYLRKLKVFAKISLLEIPFDTSITDYDSSDVIDRMLENETYIIARFEKENDTNGIKIVSDLYEKVISEYQNSINNKESNTR